MLLVAGSFFRFWARVLLEQLQATQGYITIQELADQCFLRLEDVLGTLQSVDAIKYTRGAHVISVTDKVSLYP